MLNHVPAACITFKHRDPKFRRARHEKVFRPAKEKDIDYENASYEEIKAYRANQVLRRFKAKEIDITFTSGVFDPYVPPEGDGKSSLISKQGMTDRYERTRRSAENLRSLRKIKKHEDNFKKKEVAMELQSTYIEAQKLLQNCKENKEKLKELCTPYAISKMSHGLELKTLEWEFLESLEPPKIVSLRCQEVFVSDNIFAQIIVRIHTRQKLAIYDRFGRLMFGSADLVKDVLEYVVFEKHIVNIYGKWRVHDKVLPDWRPSHLTEAVKTVKQTID